jgi:hypothetical protein
MAKCRDTSHHDAGMSPRSPERLFLPARLAGASRGELQRFAPGLADSASDKVGRGEGLGYFA